mmetsp:Transcript_34122/g.55625  ORF Transcript_34122/g.55625 Transcript_34122/m.55625 type:complete len:124 (-) Transcript_34122:14-385(-)
MIIHPSSEWILRQRALIRNHTTVTLGSQCNSYASIPRFFVAWKCSQSDDSDVSLPPFDMNVIEMQHSASEAEQHWFEGRAVLAASFRFPSAVNGISLAKCKAKIQKNNKNDMVQKKPAPVHMS